MYKIDYNPISKRWHKQIDSLPEKIKKQIDAPVGKDNLKVLRRVKRTEVKEGDIFVCSINGHIFYYGKVLKANIQHKDSNNWVNGSHIIFIFKCKTPQKDLSFFSPNYNELIVGPEIVSDGYWKLGYFETIGNISLTDEEKTLDYGFFKSNIIGSGGCFVKENGEQINHFPRYFSGFGITTYVGIYIAIRRETILNPSLLTI